MGESSAQTVAYQPGRAGPVRPPRPGPDPGLARLITELQGRGMRVEVPLESRQGGAGPADAGMLWIEGFAATVPTGLGYARTSPYVLRAEDDGWGIYREAERLASAEPFQRPRHAIVGVGILPSEVHQRPRQEHDGHGAEGLNPVC